MLSPKRLKYRRQFRGRWRSIAIKGDKLNFGTHAVKATESAWVTDRQIEACRVVLARSTRKAGRFWIRIFPDRPYTARGYHGSWKGRRFALCCSRSSRKSSI